MKTDDKAQRAQEANYNSQEAHDSSALRPEIATRWAESEALSAPRFIGKIPDELLRRDIAEETSDFGYMRRQAELQLKESEFCAVLGVAYFYIADFKDHLLVYSADGNTELLQELNERNLRVYTCMDKEVFGASAVTAALEGANPVWTLERESYQDIFKDYVFFAYNCPIGLSYRGHSKLIHLYVCRADTFTQTIKSFLEFQYELSGIRASMSTLPQVAVKDRILTENYERHRIGYIITDSNLICLDANKVLCRLLQINYLNIRGSKITDVIPKFTEVVNAFKDSNQLRNYPLIMQNHKQEVLDLYIDGDSTTLSNGFVGYTFIFKPSLYFKKLLKNTINQSARFTFKDLIGSNNKFIETKLAAMRIAKSNSNVLITGESGTGKELFAQAIHNASPRADEPFVSVNCGAIPKELIGSELFGYEPGAFTGARKNGALGKLEQANGGTIFLDEIGEMSLDMQIYLLRVLESRSVTRLGGGQSHPLNVRVISATNKNLRKAVEQGSFRLDLYYRLNVIGLNIPSLKERASDVPPLIEFYVKEMNNSLNRDVIGFSDEAMRLLQKYNWPGNIRELRNVVERCINLTPSQIISPNLLPVEIQEYGTNEDNSAISQNIESHSKTSYEDALLARIKELMKEHKGNKSVVASILGVSRGTLYRKLEKIKNWDD